MIIQMGMHSAEKPFPCNQCLKAFSERGDLKKHFRTHTGEKPFPCTQCPKAFSNVGQLQTHILIYRDIPYMKERLGVWYSAIKLVYFFIILLSIMESHKIRILDIDFKEMVFHLSVFLSVSLNFHLQKKP